MESLANLPRVSKRGKFLRIELDINSRVADFGNKTKNVCGELGWVGFLVVCFLYKTNLSPRKISCCGEKKKVARMPFLA